ncbi:hypothetical protein GCM10023189_38520 [Nibrella saemangeumensis]|uniref:histidine kinase n=2 Tax=Nibrella saemangeumensis TaxID=1084526 RepID=A0ABP8NA39_9BACT
MRTAPNDPHLLRAALDFSSNGIVIYDCVRDKQGDIQDFRVILANKKAEEITGMTEAQMLGRLVGDLFPGSLEQDFWRYAAQVIASGQPYEFEAAYPLPNGREAWYTINLAPYGDGVAVSLNDITERYLRQKSSEEQTDLIESMLNGSLNGLVMFKALRNEQGVVYDLQLKLANEAAASLTGLSPDEMVGRTLKKLFPTLAYSGLFEQYVQTIETGSSYRTESYYEADGLNGWYEILAAKFDDGVLVSFIDITASKRYQQDLQKYIEELQRSNKNLEQFAYIASHDLQEPLRKITAFGEVLQTQYGHVIDTFGTDLIDRMRSAAQRMNVLIQDLLTFSRISSQREPFRKVNLQTIVGEVLGDLETAIRDKQAVIDITVLPVVKGDALQLRQLFQNLLSNALKFTKAAIAPNIRINCVQLLGRDITPLPGTSVRASDLDKEFYAISIADNGIGFNDKYLDRIFTIFQRLHGRSEYQGTGIGLAIVQKVADNHQGYVNAHSQIGEGATFTVYLPVAEPMVEDMGVRLKK